VSQIIYPLGLRIAGKLVVVVGGGAVGSRRVKGLIEAGAKVRLISPDVTAELLELSANGTVDWVKRGFEPGDLAGSWLVHTATGLAEVDSMVTAEAEASRILVVNASVADASTAWVPSVVRHDDLTVATFGGGDPRRGMALRDAIGESLVSGLLPSERFRESDTSQVPASDSVSSQMGSVALIGGGPGDPGLITVRGLELLKAADVVVTDRLGPTSLLDNLAPNARVINVGKMPEHHPVPQGQINQILVDEAKAGNAVVRLKGGDSYVFGRGGEELAFCQLNQVPVEVVPGITSAISVPAAVGIPVTHRGVASGLTVVSGHLPIPPMDGGCDHTLVVLMGVATLRETAANLAIGKRGQGCPVAIIQEGFGSGQKVVFGTLGNIAGLAQKAGIQSPAVIVVGDVVLLSPLAREQLVEADLVDKAEDLRIELTQKENHD
jgi:uroporphyrin-III C-methyltransferase/precorrin-2 dehydrogenase/sirohydrochlorin ferrochelatase